MVTLTQIDFQYPKGGFQLRIPELAVRKGEKVAVIGPSGSGKTTLLNIIAGILKANGEVKVGEEEVHLQSDRQRRAFRSSRIGFVFQDFELLEYLTVLDNIIHLYRISSALKLDREIRQKAADLAAKLGLGNKLMRKPAELSQGERQRTAICRALLHGPDLILADEATGNLDPPNKQKILNALFELAESQCTTVIAVTHDHALLNHFDRTINFQEFAAYDE